MGRMAGNGICLAVALVFLLVGLFSLPGAAQSGPEEVILEKPASHEEKDAARRRRQPPAAPLISDTCIPIEEHHASHPGPLGLIPGPDLR